MAATEHNSAAGDNELEVLQPDQTITVGGETVVVREFRYAEGMRLMPYLQPIFDVLKGAVNGEERGDADAGSISLYDELIENQAELMISLAAQAADRPREWVESLSDDDGFRLMAAFWRANQGFFTRRLTLTGMSARAMAAATAAASGDGASRSQN